MLPAHVCVRIPIVRTQAVKADGLERVAFALVNSLSRVYCRLRVAFSLPSKDFETAASTNTGWCYSEIVFVKGVSVCGLGALVACWRS